MAPREVEAGRWRFSLTHSLTHDAGLGDLPLELVSDFSDLWVRVGGGVVVRKQKKKMGGL